MSKDKVGALFFLLLSIVYGALAFDIPLLFGGEDEAFTARTLPFALSIGGIVISLLILLLPSGSSDRKTKATEVFRGLDWNRVIQLAVLMSIYGLAIKWLGFIISTSLFLIGGYRILGERRIKILLVASVPLVLVFWFLMTKILGVYLAPGEIFFFLEEL
jgi:putative tricarboxylic transport membrane protein